MENNFPESNEEDERIPIIRSTAGLFYIDKHITNINLLGLHVRRKWYEFSRGDLCVLYDNISTLPSLQRLLVDNNTYKEATIEFESQSLKHLNFHGVESLSNFDGLYRLPNLKTVTVTGGKRFNSLKCKEIHPSLTHMTIDYAHALRSLEGLECYPNLQELIISYAVLRGPFPVDFLKANPNMRHIKIVRCVMTWPDRYGFIEYCRENNVYVDISTFTEHEVFFNSS